MGTSRRARRSAEQWAEIVEEYLASGLNETDFCKSRDLGVVSLRKWRYRQHRQLEKPSPQSRKRNFEPVAVSPPSIETLNNSVLIELGGEVKINCTLLSLESIAQLALAVRHGC